MSDQPMSNTFTCYECKQTFTRARQEEEALAEMQEEFGEDFTADDCYEVCEECYKQLMAELKEIMR